MNYVPATVYTDFSSQKKIGFICVTKVLVQEFVLKMKGVLVEFYSSITIMHANESNLYCFLSTNLSIF